MEKMTRGELATRTGISAAAIRYYEEQDILPAPLRTSNGYRMYTGDYLVKLKFIKDAKSLGYSLKEIQTTLQMLQRDMDKDMLKHLVSGKITAIEHKIQRLQLLQDQLARWLQTSDDDIQQYLQTFRNNQSI
ncbi:MerR family transcriptional regulator [Paenibacillus aquistagni]|uniref:MerR family transcriptional regulator n=1 Tax=Paenibacillus aquistagni TaxID=1852522 RepID=UPI000A1CD8E2|nr:MerR family transcriptional regulator [Paenibacillus aquistagni]